MQDVVPASNGSMGRTRTATWTLLSSLLEGAGGGGGGGVIVRLGGVSVDKVSPVIVVENEGPTA